MSKKHQQNQPEKEADIGPISIERKLESMYMQIDPVEAYAAAPFIGMWLGWLNWLEANFPGIKAVIFEAAKTIPWSKILVIVMQKLSEYSNSNGVAWFIKALIEAFRVEQPGAAPEAYERLCVPHPVMSTEAK